MYARHRLCGSNTQRRLRGLTVSCTNAVEPHEGRGGHPRVFADTALSIAGLVSLVSLVSLVIAFAAIDVQIVIRCDPASDDARRSGNAPGACERRDARAHRQSRRVLHDAARKQRDLRGTQMRGNRVTVLAGGLGFRLPVSGRIERQQPARLREPGRLRACT